MVSVAACAIFLCCAAKAWHSNVSFLFVAMNAKTLLCVVSVEQYEILRVEVSCHSITALHQVEPVDGEVEASCPSGHSLHLDAPEGDGERHPVQLPVLLLHHRADRLDRARRRLLSCWLVHQAAAEISAAMETQILGELVSFQLT